jgi:hypothetical protein
LGDAAPQAQDGRSAGPARVAHGQFVLIDATITVGGRPILIDGRLTIAPQA